MENDFCDTIRNMLGFVGLLFLLISFVFNYIIQPKYIIRRYEAETDLSNKKYFQHSAILFAHGYFGKKRGIAQIYTIHLFALLIIGDKLFSKLISFNDLKSRNDILKHFSIKEKIYTLFSGMSVFLFVFFGTAFCLWDVFVCHKL